MKIQIVTDRVHWRPRADYTLQVDENAKLIRIVDQDLGNMSVTNDLDRVLVDIAPQIDETLDNYSITYRDSTGTWDRIVVAQAGEAPNVFDVEIRPGPGPDPERRDPMARQ